MKLGVVFPQTEIGDDPEHLARFARTAEAHIDALADYWNAVQSLAS